MPERILARQRPTHPGCTRGIGVLHGQARRGWSVGPRSRLSFSAPPSTALSAHPFTRRQVVPTSALVPRGLRVCREPRGTNSKASALASKGGSGRSDDQVGRSMSIAVCHSGGVAERSKGGCGRGRRSLAVIVSGPRCTTVIASRDTGSLLPAGWSDCEIHPTDKVIRYFGSRELIDGHALPAGRRERNAWSVGMSTDRPRFQPFECSCFCVRSRSSTR